MLSQQFLTLFFFFSFTFAKSQTFLSSTFEAAPHHRNAHHIFNVIHSSMRQWGSSLNHNGVSYFPARVPKGTEFYHGTSGSAPKKGLEWLAFEPEHAQIFARGRSRGPGGGGGGPPGGRGGGGPPGGGGGGPPGGGNGRGPPGGPGGGPPPFHAQSPKGPRMKDDAEPDGYLHTYITKHNLQLLYIDGMSAGKTQNGTLDSQDFVLLNETEMQPGFMEYHRAQVMCNISRDAWGGRVDGFLRMEGGFEIILCDFEKHLDLLRATVAHGECVDCVQGWGLGNFNYLRAVADRYHGIEGGRVKINYENFVTAYTLNDDLFTAGERGPRLKDLSGDALTALRKQIDEMVMSEPNPFAPQGTDWQAVADMIVKRYSSRLKYLAMPHILHDSQRFNYELDYLLSSFTDYGNRSQNTEIQRCATHFMPSDAAPSLAAEVVAYVSHHICSQLFKAQVSNAETKVKIVEQLGRTLNWTTWKECGPCGYDEICSIPVWPYGSEEDWENPRCTNASRMDSQRGYWGDNRPRGPLPPKGWL